TPGHEHLVQYARPGEHLWGLRHGGPRALRDRLRGHARLFSRRLDPVDRLRVPGQTRGPEEAPADHRALPAAARLGGLVRGDVHAGRLSVDASLQVEAAAWRSRRDEPPGERSLPRRAAALDPCLVLPVRVRAAGESEPRLVAAPASRRLDSGALG